MNERAFDLNLISDKSYFLELSRHKDLSIELLEEISNAFSQDMLKNIFPNSKGKKISSGNNLYKCPYQVLDLIRNFDGLNGLNIRLLHWWGHGCYLLVFFGNNNISYFHQNIMKLIIEDKLSIVLRSDPWNYENLDKFLCNFQISTLNDKLEKSEHLQLVKKIPLKKEFNENLKAIIAEIQSIFKNLEA
jgi:hypothetical protein